jgi:ABC-type multidrug transport system permease subunit
MLFVVIMSTASDSNIITDFMIYLVSSILVYSFLEGVHHLFFKGLREKVYAAIHLVSTGMTFFLIYSGMVR